MTAGATGIEGAFSAMNLQRSNVPVADRRAAGNSPGTVQKYVVRHFTPEEQKDVEVRVGNYIQAKNDLAATREAKSAAIQAREAARLAKEAAARDEADAKSKKEAAQVKAVAVQANIVKLDAEAQQKLDAALGILNKMRATPNVDVAKAAKIDTLIGRIQTFKANYPADTAQQKLGMQALQQEVIQLVQGPKAGAPAPVKK